MSAPTTERPVAPEPQAVRPGTDVPRSLTVPGVLAPTLASWGAVLLAALCLGPLFDGSGWFGATLLVVTVVTAIGGLSTWLRVPMVLVPVLCAVGLFAALVQRFTDSAPWGFIPTLDALSDLRLVLAEGSADISRFAPPVPASEGLTAVTALGVGSVALVVVVLQVVLRLPAVAGLPLVAMYVVPAAELSEGAQLHLPRLRTRPQDFDPDTRERFMAGALLPGAWYVKAQRFRRQYRANVLKLFDEVDVILAPATPCTAPRLGQTMMKIAGVELPVRANLGLFTQPISFIGLPVAVAPLQKPGGLPIGVQLIARPYNEQAALRVAAYLEKQGVASAPPA